MRMKNKIQNNYPSSVFYRSSSAKIYLADFTERTDSKRKVEFHETTPQEPNSDKDMDCLIFNNPLQLSVVCNIFDDHQFKCEDGKDLPHCECVLFPESKRDDIGAAFVEIKDCKPKNVSVYKNKVKSQIISTVHIFREQGIIGQRQCVYGIVSFPRIKKMSFNHTIFSDVTEYKELYHKYRIHFLPTNNVSIVNERKLSAQF